MPKYKDLANSIQKKIISGEYIGKLPTEFEMVEKYSVSRNTVRRAIDLLIHRGLVQRTQGSGIFVKDEGNATKYSWNLSLNRGFSQHFDSRELQTEIIEFKETVADKKIVTHLKCSLGAPIYYIARRRIFEEKTLAVETSYFLKEVTGPMNELVMRNSIFDFLENYVGIDMKYTDSLFRVKLLNETEKKYFDIDSSETVPTLLLTETHYLSSRQIFNYSETFYDYHDFSFYFSAEY